MAIKCMHEATPFIYCYSTPDIPSHNGWVKIGYTEQIVDKRLAQQTKTAGIRCKEEWRDFAIYTDGSGLTFTDNDFRAYLLEKGINNRNTFGDNEESIGNEWYQITAEEARMYFEEFRKKPSTMMRLKKYNLRNEQKQAIAMTTELVNNHKDAEILWNAKPRFGKCLSCYDFCTKMKFRNILIVTNRPAVANSWYSDYVNYLGRESGYFFVSRVSEIIGKSLVISYEEYLADKKCRDAATDTKQMGLIYFVSLQDIKSSRYFRGNGYDKLHELVTINWDILVVDESHEGVATYKTEAAFSRIKRDCTLYLSGTPFKAIKDEKFSTDFIYNWTYVSEQEAKERWDGEGCNPYLQLPQLHMITYRLSNIIGEDKPDLSGLDEPMEDGLNEFFKVSNGKFIHDSDIDLFINTIASNEKYPFGSINSRNELKHTFWLLMRVDSVKALATKLKAHHLFKDYDIIIAAGDGKDDENEGDSNSYKNVMQAIENCDNGSSGKHGTITLSVRQLTTGVTIPQWTGVLMLSERDSAAEYMQASFRAQNPYVFSRKDKMTGKTSCYRKTDAYIFDFNPEHTLEIVEQFANNLYTETVNGHGDYTERKTNIANLLKYMPVTGENDAGDMELFSPDRVLQIPRRMKSEEVVRHGFMCDKLFQNVTNVFRLDNALWREIVGRLSGASQQTKKSTVFTITPEERKKMSLDDEGEVRIDCNDVEREEAETVTSKDKEVLKERAKLDIKNVTIDASTSIMKIQNSERKDLTKAYIKAAQEVVIAKIKETHHEAFTKETENLIKRKLTKQAEDKVNRLYDDYQFSKQEEIDTIHQEMKEFTSKEDKAAIDEIIKEAEVSAAKKLESNILNSLDSFIENEVFSTAIAAAKETEATKLKKEKEDQLKSRLKGFTRTIPSFLMAYGCDEFSLFNLEKYIPNDVFKDVTSITLDEFKILRDDCNCFEPTVFDDSIHLFLKKRDELVDYFVEDAKEDIFDYIPPQRTNQIYTPRMVVKKMLNLLEVENPGCFDNPDTTFIDPYMKSGLYVTEIVKRLYRSPKMVELYPDKDERLQHIFSKQVFGLAPTEIIYAIAIHYIFGFAEKHKMAISQDNFKMCDMLPYAKGVMGISFAEKLDELFR